MNRYKAYFRYPFACSRTLLLLLGLFALLQAVEADTRGYGSFLTRTNLEEQVFIRGVAEWPFEYSVVEEGGTGVIYPYRVEGGAVFNLWLYANETGRVRAESNTGPGNYANTFTREFQNALVWQKTYRKTNESDTAHFTMNTSNSLVRAALLGDIGFNRFARFYLKIILHRDDLGDNASEEEKHQTQYVAEVEISEADGQRNLEFKRICSPGADEFWICRGGYDQNVEAGGSDGSVLSLPYQSSVFTATEYGESVNVFITYTYQGTIDLSQIPVDSKFTIEYRLSTGAANIGLDGPFAEAFIGDPLSLDDGVAMAIDSTPLDDGAKPVRSCNVEVDPFRFSVNTDGTLTDNYSGLMWQRCPLGYDLDESGTPDDFSDDRCVLSGTGPLIWQTALQTAASNSLAGYVDWRVPNVKELDSITALNCLAPAIESEGFPDTPPDRFWTSTPGRNSNSVMNVSFLFGDVINSGKEVSAYARLVRSTATPPVTPLPAISINRPIPVLEGDTGSTDMIFTVTLDRPAAQDISIQYTTRDHTALAGEDYQTTAGTLMLAAGAKMAEIRVPITGDLIGETDEGFYVVLSTTSPWARLKVAGARGVITNDEPLVSVRKADVYEGNSGTSNLGFVVMLSRPLTEAVMLDYTTADGSADSATDYTASTGTLDIPPGQTYAYINVPVQGDNEVEGDEYFNLVISNVSNNAKLSEPGQSARGYIVGDDVPELGVLNDTGVVSCFASRDISGAECPQAAFPGQDAETGRDVDFNDDTDGPAGFVFTKLDANGVPLPDQTQPYATTPWSCVQDEVTGLMWEVKTNDDGLYDKDWKFSWYNSSGINDGGDPGSENGGSCVDASNCDTEKYVNQVNAAGLCGYTDWRLPSATEAMSIVYDQTDLYLHDSTYFPNRLLSVWTSTPSVDRRYARQISNKQLRDDTKTNAVFNSAVILVRGGIVGGL